MAPQESEQFLQIAEDITGVPYPWARFDMVVLPPSFPFGGMENANATFLTPTLLSGDRALADVVAHEQAHSWTGNLVTNHTWTHFWLNEGWTVWLERAITAEITVRQMFPELEKGSAERTQRLREASEFRAQLGRMDWEGAVERMVKDGETDYAKLIPNLQVGCGGTGDCKKKRRTVATVVLNSG